MPFPNKDAQFKPGQSGNPLGKPKGTKSMATHIKDLLNDEEFETYLPDIKEGWKQFKGAPVKAIVKAIAIKAMNGDVKAFDALAKHAYGQKLDVTSNGETMGQATEQLSDEELDERIARHLARRKPS